MLISDNDRVLNRAAIAIRFKILIFILLLLVTRARKFEIKRNHDYLFESLNLDAVTFDMLHLVRNLTVHYWTKRQEIIAD